jgi:hypothetical protein
MRNLEQMASPAPADDDLFGDYSPAVTCASALILVLAIATIDKLTGYELQIGVLHLIPITMVTWAAGRNWGLGLSFLAVALWVTMFRNDMSLRSSLYFYWDGAVLLGTCVAFVVLVARLRDAVRTSEFTFLESLNTPAYIVDLKHRAVLYGNAAFRDWLAARSLDELSRYAAKESMVKWPGGRRALLRILVL